MFLWRQQRSATLRDGEAPGPCAIPSPIPPTLSANFRKIPAICLRNVQTKRSHLPSNRQIPPQLCLDTNVVFSSRNVSSRDRPSSPDRRRSARLYCPCAHTEPLSRAKRRRPARSFG